MKNVPEALNKIVDIVLAYRPKPKTKAAKNESGYYERKEAMEMDNMTTPAVHPGGQRLTITRSRS